QAVIQAKAKLESAEAELPFLLGTPDRKAIKALSFSPDGKMLAAATADTTVKLWDTATGREVGSMRLPVHIYLRFSPDAKTLLSRDDKGALRIWDVATGKDAKINEDAEFVRRVSLDFTGVLPTPETVQKFLQSKDPDKAAKFVDELLASPDFTQHVHRAWV